MSNGIKISVANGREMANFIQLRFVCDCGKEDSKLILKASQYDPDEYPECCGKMKPIGLQIPTQTHYVMKDITPYQSVIDKTYITSRSQHRDHMIKHDVIEVGNERMDHIKPPGYQKGDLRGRLKHELEKRNVRS